MFHRLLIVVQGSGEVLVYAWKKDNSGPPNVTEVMADWRQIQVVAVKCKQLNGIDARFNVNGRR
jgi:hypothetical protein